MKIEILRMTAAGTLRVGSTEYERTLILIISRGRNRQSENLRNAVAVRANCLERLESARSLYAAAWKTSR